MQIVIFILSMVTLGILALILGNYLGEKLENKFNQLENEQKIKDAQLLIMLRYKVQELDRAKNYREISKAVYKQELIDIDEQVKQLERKYLSNDE